MREILFRGKRDDGEWVEGYFVHCKSTYDDETGRTAEIIPHNADRIYDGEYCPFDVHKVILETVGQFTGLTDKNGTKIFEGDIVRYMKKETMVVSWRNESASFVGTYSAINFNNCASLMNAHIYLEVIGNIHDNPELLEVTQ